jgi:hypothetical protein
MRLTRIRTFINLLSVYDEKVKMGEPSSDVVLDALDMVNSLKISRNDMITLNSEGNQRIKGYWILRQIRNNHLNDIKGR